MYGPQALGLSLWITGGVLSVEQTNLISAGAAVTLGIIAMVLALIEGTSLFTSLFAYYLVSVLVFYTVRTELTQE